MIRVGSLTYMKEADPYVIDIRSGMNAEEQLFAIYNVVRTLYRKRDNIFFSLGENLAESGIEKVSISKLDTAERLFIERFFKNRIINRIKTEITEELYPFNESGTRKFYLVGIVKQEKKGRTKFAISAIDDDIPGVIILPKRTGKIRYILTQDILLSGFEKMTAPFRLREKVFISLTRNGEIRPDEEICEIKSSARKKMKKLIAAREKALPVRVEIDKDPSTELKEYLLRSLGLSAEMMFVSKAPLDMSFISYLEEIIPDEMKMKLSYIPFAGMNQLRDIKSSVFERVRKRDIFSSYPYDNMDVFLEFMREASERKDVTGINMTIYRLATHPEIVKYLVKAAENGKKVRVVVELQARFDEANNIDWSEFLERRGCQVFYGKDGYKVHSKLCQAVISSGKKNKYVTQIGTGNYNEKTAKQYTDLSLITSNKHIGEEVATFFDDILKGKTDGKYDKILAAPSELRKKLIKLIERETSKKNKGRIFFKVNSVTDIKIIEKLAEASCAGVKIRMIVRGICCILPGIEHCTENIEIVNVVGRFLEHSRIYVFGSGDDEKVYISSADLMTRNTVKRFELACPVYDSRIRNRIKNILYLNFNDTVKGRKLNMKGKYVRKDRSGRKRIDSQQTLMFK